MKILFFLLLLFSFSASAKFVLVFEEPEQPEIKRVAPTPGFRLNVVKEPAIKNTHPSKVAAVANYGRASKLQELKNRGEEMRGSVNEIRDEVQDAPVAATMEDVDAIDSLQTDPSGSLAQEERRKLVVYRSVNGETLDSLLGRWGNQAGMVITLSQSASRLGKAVLHSDASYGESIHEAMSKLASLLNRKLKAAGMRVAIVSVDDGIILEVL